MAGIGFQLAKTAREGGVGGIVGAAAFGAVISAGPWLITAIAVVMLDGWSVRHLGSRGALTVQTVLVYAFSLSALAAAPIGILATRMAADRIFARDAGGVTGIVIAALAWVFAVPLFDWIGADVRAIFAFRQTSLGAVFHLVAIGTTVVLAYYDLFGRILVTWSLFAIGSAVATLAQWDQGFAAFGWGYMAGAVVGASVGLALVAEATVNLTYLLFVGNNPSVVGHGGRLL